jgi:hypothetical protein
MKYYCKACKSTIETEYERDVCPVCVADQLYTNDTDAYNSIASGYRQYFIPDIPAYETVAQWEARTGRTYPDSAPVYFLHDEGWGLTINDALKCSKIVATDAGAPPNDWRPEE